MNAKPLHATWTIALANAVEKCARKDLAKPGNAIALNALREARLLEGREMISGVFERDEQMLILQGARRILGLAEAVAA
ncbi:protein of unknown function (plasmid) [Magnetospirillum sp. XM-1]|uniref:hypothetical protein n=1 Tax=unclassified Magnetospirillum TaxID=2617991 RepID=UPI00073DB7A7|nr:MULTISPECIES: hypothetical protein [unclassified Magnetospirillum]CUW41985.1 protein of unknown function [Magnetospirillum sp. XM-1]